MKKRKMKLNEPNFLIDSNNYNINHTYILIRYQITCATYNSENNINCCSTEYTVLSIKDSSNHLTNISYFWSIKNRFMLQQRYCRNLRGHVSTLRITKHTYDRSRHLETYSRNLGSKVVCALATKLLL